ncbi:hypothetical protein E3Q18_02781 [Wallemia mellicola]|nr:hypothetical protein E3Q18_02781 [Wallemia mellicola]TIC23829.1 hypothetical protein E3Q11_03777 [Wallemia mellicola]TIC50296.1 hypothetical protein E3Q05_03499 [Wallemia mellicola]
MTGDIRFDINELQHIQSTLISYQLGTIASNHNLRSYVKLTYPFYNFNSKPSSESVELTPQGERGIWWHESIRSLSSISNLPLVVLRIGAWYGPFQLNGKITPRIICADIYRHLKEDIKFLWNADLRLNTIHSQDVARALIALSNWRAATPDVDPQSNTFKSYAPDEKLKQFDLPQSGTVARAPLFNLVDESDATQSSVADQIAKVFKVKTSFLGGLISTFARMDMEEMVQDVNEMHLDAWSDMLKKSDIKDTPLTPYLDEHFFKKNPIALDASKISKTIGFKCLHKKITVEDIEGIVKGFRVVLIIIFDWFSVTIAVGVGLVTRNRQGGFGLGYAATVLIHPGYIDQSYTPNYIPSSRGDNDKETTIKQSENFPPTFRVQDARFEPTFCQECRIWRPARAHHCRHSGRCVWEFDHYCPWIGQSVGGNNHKHFITFLFCLTSDEHGDGLWSGRGRGPIIGAISISAFFAFFVAGLLFNHIWLACDSVTTFEDMFDVRTIRARDQSVLAQHYESWQLRQRKACRDHWYYIWGHPRKEGNLWWLDSSYHNWCSRMGSNPLIWFVPFAKEPHDIYTIEYNPRFDEHGRARQRQDWPAHLR